MNFIYIDYKNKQKDLFELKDSIIFFISMKVNGCLCLDV